jgi:integrase
MAVRIDTVEGRSRLKVRPSPYWQRLTASRHLGFRKMSAATDGSWLCQFYDPDDGKQTRRSLGDFGHLPPSQRFDSAKAAAEEWFRHLDQGGKLSEPLTVKAACANYVEHLRGLGKDKTADDVKRRFAQYVDSKPLAAIELQRLKPRDIEGWRKSLATTMVTPQDKSKVPTRPRSPSTINRDMTPLRAALNLALADGHVTTDSAWKSKMRPLKDADRQREVYLDLAQRRSLIAKAPADLAVFISALSLLPVRPGALAALTVSSFDRRLSTLTIGKDKHGRDRKILLPPATASFFAEQCKDKFVGADRKLSHL